MRALGGAARAPEPGINAALRAVLHFPNFPAHVPDLLVHFPENPPEEHDQGSDDGYAETDEADNFGVDGPESSKIPGVLRVIQDVENGL